MLADGAVTFVLDLRWGRQLVKSAIRSIKHLLWFVKESLLKVRDASGGSLLSKEVILSLERKKAP